MNGRVALWHEDDGWGVISSPSTPGGCWFHYSSIALSGDRRVIAGEPVQFEANPAIDQDGYRFVATSVRPSRNSLRHVEGEYDIAQRVADVRSGAVRTELLSTVVEELGLGDCAAP